MKRKYDAIVERSIPIRQSFPYTIWFTETPTSSYLDILPKLIGYLIQKKNKCNVSVYKNYEVKDMELLSGPQELLYMSQEIQQQYPIYDAPWGKYEMSYQGSIIVVEFLRCQLPYTEPEISLSTTHSLALLQEFAHACWQYQDVPPPNEISIYTFFGKKWQLDFSTRKRKLETVFLPKGMMAQIIKTITQFQQEQEEYMERGIPYHKHILLTGLPGCGKTSTITAIASHFSFNIYSFRCGPQTTNARLHMALASVPTNGLLVIEDVDSLFEKREKKGNMPFSLSDFLNDLDGCGNRPTARIVFFTANDIKMIDAALLRAGRCDLIIVYDFATRYQIRCLYNSYFPMHSRALRTDFLQKIRNTKVTTAVLQKVFFEHRKELGSEKLLPHIEQEMRILGQMTYDPSFMYS